MDEPTPKLYRRRGPTSFLPKYFWAGLQSLREFASHFEWIHISLGIFGNVAFLIGSIFFLWESLQTAGIWLFILGSLGMLISSVGSAILQAERN